MMQEMTSPKKIAKKARQIFRKELRNEAQRLGGVLGNMMKPKPRWVPWWLWMAGVRIFIKVKR